MLLAGATALPVMTFSVEPSTEGKSPLELGRECYEMYDFEGAAKHYAAFARQKRKTAEETGELETYRRELSDAESFLERVEKIAIIDSITVNADGFFKAYRLPASAGSLLDPEEIPFAERRGDATMAFTNENRNFMMWCESDTTGHTRLVESIKLIDGTWHEPTMAPEELNGGGDADFPFMMADGTTLYYANDGEESIGGLDIFVATRDAQTGEYLQPQNIGMPYNSPFDDYMLAIDELNGVGWWATDRNCLDDEITIYVFMTNDMRKNYNPAEEERDYLVRQARIASIADTRNPEDEEKYAAILRSIRAINPNAAARKADFHFPVGHGEEYTCLKDFPSETSRTAMKNYLAAEKEFTRTKELLTTARRNYHAKASKSAAAECMRLEQLADSQREKTRKARSEVYRALKR